MEPLTDSLNTLIFSKSNIYNQVLILLFNRNRPLKIWYISREIGRPPGLVSHNLKILQEVEIINKIKGISRSLDISLTDKGRLIAKKIKALKKLIREHENGK